MTVGWSEHSGVIRAELDRPEALNALTTQMVIELHAALDAATASGRPLVITGAGDRAFCAGGDIRAVWELARSGDPSVLDFFRHEYRMNAAIGAASVPVVVVMDRIVMGGGLGVGGHASHRVVTERTRLAMPEVGIGFVPDVGSTWLLAHAPGDLGLWMALTGEQISGADAIALGLADVFVASDDVPDLVEQVTASGDPAVLTRFARPAPESALLARREWIDQRCAKPTLADLVDALAADDHPDAGAALAVLAQRSPWSMALAWAMVRRAASLPSLQAALAMEFDVAAAAVAAPDFIEGVRAQLVDKDRSPKWSCVSVHSVDPAAVDTAFTPRSDGPFAT